MTYWPIGQLKLKMDINQSIDDRLILRGFDTTSIEWLILTPISIMVPSKPLKIRYNIFW